MLKAIIQALLNFFIKNPMPMPIKPTPIQPPVPIPAAYLWDTVDEVKHSIRIICDEEGLNLEQKNTMYATIGGESEYILDAVCLNLSNGESVSTRYAQIVNERQILLQKGITILSIDYGLCQWNGYYHGKEITPSESVNDPEKAVRLMCGYWLRGQRNQWIAYKSGRYLKFMP